MIIIGSDNKKFRNELKYPISRLEMENLLIRIKNILALDKHVGEERNYNISSLYFDDIYDTCYFENENGTDPREKFRIRIYNHSIDRITLECKRKERGKTYKTSCLLTVDQTEMILNGRYLRNIGNMDPLLQKFTFQMMQNGLKPKVIVEYDRIPFVSEHGNVRVTFDMNLSSSSDIKCFLTGADKKRPVMPVDKLLMEVKYDEYLPQHIYDALSIDNLTQMAYSKYYLCRKFEI